MLPRQGLVEIFSTFIQFSEDHFAGWITDAKLRQNMQRYLNQLNQQKTTERFWAIFWHKQWHQDSSYLARNHLSAYLQEICYWTTTKTLNRTKSLQYKLSDIFQMAIAEIDKILAGYKPEQGTSIKTYANVMFRSLIANLLRQSAETDICTDWALLRKLSKKRLQNALTNAGLNETEINSYLLIWTCFKTIYTPTQTKITQKLPPPDESTYQAISELYVAESLNQLGKKASPITPTNLEKILKQCAKLARSYLYPKSISLNVTPTGVDSGEIIDTIPSINPNSLTEMIATEEERERKQQQTDLETVLVTAIDKLKPEMKTILKLYFAEGLNQQEIAENLKTKQYTISRRLSRAKELLIKALAVWSQNNLNRTLNTEVLQQMSGFIDEWLIKHYQAINE